MLKYLFTLKWAFGQRIQRSPSTTTTALCLNLLKYNLRCNKPVLWSRPHAMAAVLIDNFCNDMFIEQISKLV